MKDCRIFADISTSEIWTEFTVDFIQDIFSKGQIISKDNYQQTSLISVLRSSYTSSDDFLTNLEISDVQESNKEIQEGKAKEFTNVADFLRELKT